MGQEHDSQPSGGELNGNARRMRLQAGEYEEGVVAIAHHGGETSHGREGLTFQEEKPGRASKVDSKEVRGTVHKDGSQQLQH